MAKFIRYKEKYIVSDDGRVWKITNNGLRLKKQSKNNSGYLATSIECKATGVHRIVLDAFVGESELEVDHKNRNKLDNRLENLEYVTHKENVKRYNAKKVRWGDKDYNSLKEVADIVGEKTTGGISRRIKNGYKLRGENIEYI